MPSILYSQSRYRFHLVMLPLQYFFPSGTWNCHWIWALAGPALNNMPGLGHGWAALPHLFPRGRHMQAAESCVLVGFCTVFKCILLGARVIGGAGRSAARKTGRGRWVLTCRSRGSLSVSRRPWGAAALPHAAPTPRQLKGELRHGLR